MTSVEIISVIKDITLASAACVAGYVALAGLGAWRKELSGRANFDVARQLAKSVYVLRDQVSYCRSPFTAEHEFPEEFNGGLSNHTDEEVGQAWAHVYSNRWKLVGKATQEFDTAVLEAEALWGQEIKHQCVEFTMCVRILQRDIEAFISDKYTGGQNFKDIEFAKRVKAGIWDMRSDENELTKRIDNAIQGIESFLRPHLSRS